MKRFFGIGKQNTSAEVSRQGRERYFIPIILRFYDCFVSIVYSGSELRFPQLSQRL